MNMNHPDHSLESLKSNLLVLSRRAESANTLAAILTARLAEQRREIEALRTCLCPAAAQAGSPASAPPTPPESIVSPYD
jgi:hypothetical protein